MRVESMSSRLDFDERRARALEGVVQYRPGAVPPLQPPSRRRDQPRERARRRGEQAERRRAGGAAADGGEPASVDRVAAETAGGQAPPAGQTAGPRPIGGAAEAR